jgi:hypothetical protein
MHTRQTFTLAGTKTMHQEKECGYAAIDLSSDEILFILSCIESSDGQNIKEITKKSLYVRLVKRYVNLVTDRIEPNLTARYERQVN